MRVFEFRAAEDQEWAVPVKDEDFEIFQEFDGTSRSRTWIPVPMRLVRDDGRGHPFFRSDLPWLAGYAPVLRGSAAAVLREHIAPYGELLPLECTDAELFVLNVTRVIDALDLNRSTVIRSSIDGRATLVTKYVFRPEIVVNERVFKLPQFPRAGKVYVNQDLVELVRKSEFQRVDFRLLWEDKPTTGRARVEPREHRK